MAKSRLSVIVISAFLVSMVSTRLRAAINNSTRANITKHNIMYEIIAAQCKRTNQSYDSYTDRRWQYPFGNAKPRTQCALLLLIAIDGLCVTTSTKSVLL